MMEVWEHIVASFAWGVVVGIIIHRGYSTGKWSIKP